MGDNDLLTGKCGGSMKEGREIRRVLKQNKFMFISEVHFKREAGRDCYVFGPGNFEDDNQYPMGITT